MQHQNDQGIETSQATGRAVGSKQMCIGGALRFKWRPWGRWVLENVLMLVLLAGVVVAMTWPWAAKFGDRFAAHQDPPLHAWKVWNVAEQVLAGHWRPTGINLNAYYPHSGSMYYESLYWPQGVVAAPVLAATGNPVLAFHLSYLLFWALSGVCMKGMLRELGAGKAAAWLGGAVFVLLPYRMGYVVEFNMQLCFGLPLTVWGVARWTRTKSVRGGMAAAAAAAGALGLQAISELYQAVFFGFALVFVALALWRGRWGEWLKNRRTWASAATGVLVLGAVGLAYLAPYGGQLDESVSREVAEVTKHELEPFSYAASGKHMRWSTLPQPKVKEREICVYPTLAVGLAALAWGAARFRRRWRGGGKWERGLRAGRAGVLAAFLGWTGIGLSAGGLGAVEEVYAWLPVAMALMSVAIPFVSAYRDEQDRIMDGLWGGAVFAFLMGLGPTLFPLGNEWQVESPLYLGLYNALPMLHGFRVVARFGIVVLLFVTAAAALGCDMALKAAKRQGGWRAKAIWAGVAAALALTVAESVPKPLTGTCPGRPREGRVIDALVERTGAPAVLAVVPRTTRDVDALEMFRVAGANQDRLLVMAWGGAYPRFTKLYMRNYKKMERGDSERWRKQLTMLWPECRVLVDKKTMAAGIGPEQRKVLRTSLEAIAEKEDEDGEFEVWRLKGGAPERRVEKFIRSDLLAERPAARFRIVPEGGETEVEVLLDGKLLGRLEVPEDGEDYWVDLSGAKKLAVEPNHVRFNAGRPIRVENFNCEPAPGKEATWATWSS